MKLGEKQVLTIEKKVEFGVYLGTEQEHVLLPKKQVPEGAEPGDPVEVFIYRDSSDRLIATTAEPKLMMGELKVLEVADTGKNGAFLDWGLEKDLFLPFKEQTGSVKKGDKCLVSLYIDKSDRLCATMKVYDKLSTDSPYKKDDMVEGIVYEINEKFGVFVAVDEKYSAMIPKREVYKTYHVGEYVRARIAAVKENGKLDLSVREKAFIQMDVDAAKLMEYMKKNGGRIPFTDKASPEVIRQEFAMSKNEFKRAVGRLLKEKRIEIREKDIVLSGK
nr:S1-like domain-containing RNA-binding protein [uncultured Sellimonas sp.]